MMNGAHERGLKVNSGRNTRDSYRNPNMMMKTCRIYQLLIQRLNEVAWIALQGQHFASTSLLVICAFSTIHFFGFHNFGSVPEALAYLVFPACLLIFLVWIVLVHPMCATLKVHSRLLRKAWKNKLGTENGRAKELRRFIDSCHDLDLSIGSFFSYQISTMPVVIDICVGHTITCLLGAE